MLTLLALALIGAAPVPTPALDEQVRAAIVAAVRSRVGAGADVRVDELRIEGDMTAPVFTAVPEPGARLERPIRFALRPSGETRLRSGFATARITIAVAHAHAAHDVDHGVELADLDVISATHEIAAGPLRAWPTVATATQARTTRALAKDACIPSTAIVALPAVVGGRDVVAIARIDGVEAAGTLVAAENGDLGDVIRVMNRQTRRALKARVISAGRVKIIQ